MEMKNIFLNAAMQTESELEKEAERFKLEKGREAIEAADIHLPNSISRLEPLSLEKASGKFRQLLKERGLEDNHIYSYAVTSNSSNRVQIIVRMLVGASDEVVAKLSRSKTLKWGFLKGLLEYPGFDEILVREAERIIKKASRLFDETKDKEGLDYSFKQAYREVITAVVYRDREEAEKKDCDFKKKIITIDGKETTIYCIKGSDNLRKALPQGVKPLEFLREAQRLHLLHTSETRTYDYCETGGQHWYHLIERSDREIANTEEAQLQRFPEEAETEHPSQEAEQESSKFIPVQESDEIPFEQQDGSGDVLDEEELTEF